MEGHRLQPDKEFLCHACYVKEKKPQLTTQEPVTQQDQRTLPQPSNCPLSSPSPSRSHSQEETNPTKGNFTTAPSIQPLEDNSSPNTLLEDFWTIQLRSLRYNGKVGVWKGAASCQIRVWYLFRNIFCLQDNCVVYYHRSYGYILDVL
ncbi:hypothetical protein JTE90_025899 [Oedothorax gibbosus]|uniref:Uncharacterized protein n=1 Tax=Oedothorax gibbosus TaxID=931172 RepID=A0AAV6TZB4_9ARAC|nr:hypothetical protein JTE90_025899 [Oedothorax gibbosus]